MKNIILIFGIIITLLIGGCRSTNEEILAAIEVCNNNGGLAFYEIDHSAVCANGATINNPLESLKIMKGKNNENP